MQMKSGGMLNDTKFCSSCFKFFLGNNSVNFTIISIHQIVPIDTNKNDKRSKEKENRMYKTSNNKTL